MDVARQPVSLTMVLALLLGGLFAVRHILMPWPAEQTVVLPGIVPGDLLAAAAVRYSIPAAVLCLLMVLSNMLSLARTVIRNQISTARNYTTPLLYLVMAFALFIPDVPLIPVTASFFIWRGVIYFIGSFKRDTSFGRVFLGAFFISLAPIVYPQAIVYVLLVPIALQVFRRSPREGLAALTGLIAPWFIAAYAIWAFGGGFTDIFISLYDAVIGGSDGFPVGAGLAGILAYVFCGLAVALTILGIVSYLLASTSMRTRASAIMTLMLFATLIAAGGLFMPGASWSDMAIAALPASMMATLFFVRFTGRITLIIYILLLVSAAVLNLFPFVSGPLGL